MLKHVLIPLDGSILAEEALTHARDIVAKGGLLSLLVVIELPVAYDYALVDLPMTMLPASAISKDESDAAYRRAGEYLERVGADLRNDGYKVDLLTEVGEPAEVILETAQRIGIDAIVISTHGRTGIDRWIFGSVTQKVLSRTSCPVYVVPGLKREQAAQPKQKKLRSAPST